VDDQTEVPEQYVVLFLQRDEEHASDPESYKDAKARADVMEGEEDIQVLSVMTEAAYKQRVKLGNKKFRVKYQDAGLDGPSYTRPMSYAEANLRKQMMRTQDGISDVEMVDVETIADESASIFRTEGADEHQRMIEAAKSYHQSKLAQISGDMDESLNEPAIGAFSTLPEEPDSDALDDWEKALEEEVSEPAASKAVAIDSWSQKQNRNTALDYAMKLATMPLGGMSVQTAGPAAEKVVENARIFLAFLNEEGTGA
jgi:hypothetical protein